MIHLVTPVDPGDLAVMVNNCMTHQELLEFILTLDSYAADYEFTQELRNKLTEALELEDEAIE